MSISTVCEAGYDDDGVLRATRMFVAAAVTPGIYIQSWKNRERKRVPGATVRFCFRQIFADSWVHVCMYVKRARGMALRKDECVAHGDRGVPGVLPFMGLIK